MKNRIKVTFKQNSFYKTFLTSLIITGLGYGIYNDDIMILQ